MEFGWINLIGAVILVLLLIPNVVYAVRDKGNVRQTHDPIMVILEQTGRYASMAFMCLPLLVGKFGFHSVGEMLLYIGGNAVLLVMYYIYWGFYFKKPKRFTALALAIIPVCIFLLSGILLRHWLLVISGILFGIGHISITAKGSSSI